MIRKVTIEKVDNGYIVEILFPYPPHLYGERRVETSLALALERILKFFEGCDNNG